MTLEERNCARCIHLPCFIPAVPRRPEYGSIGQCRCVRENCFVLAEVADYTRSDDNHLVRRTGYIFSRIQQGPSGEFSRQLIVECPSWGTLESKKPSAAVPS